MKRNTFLIAAVTAVTLAPVTQSCVALATSSVGLAVLKINFIRWNYEGTEYFQQ